MTMEQRIEEPTHRKVGGNYQADGWIVGRFCNRNGDERVVFEFAVIPGMLHIFSPHQVERIDTTKGTLNA